MIQKPNALTDLIHIADVCVDICCECLGAGLMQKNIRGVSCGAD